jgi:hypothetical protein
LYCSLVKVRLHRPRQIIKLDNIQIIYIENYYQIPVFKSPVVVTAGAAAVPAIKADCCPEVIVIAVVSAV